VLYFTAIWYFYCYFGIFLWPSGIFAAILVHFPSFGFVVPRKSGSPAFGHLMRLMRRNA
jgi:hypothetical protein